MATTVTLVFPTYNRAICLANALNSLRALVVPQGVHPEVLVIDNNCSDDTASVVTRLSNELPLRVRYVVESQQGLSHCKNRGLRESDAEHIVFLDDDIEIAPNWLVGYFEAVRQLGADCVFGPVFPMFDAPIPPYLTERILNRLSSPYTRRGDDMFLLPSESASEVPGGNSGVKRAIATQIGGFDAALGRCGTRQLAGEDFDFAARLSEAGARTAYHPSCWIRHLISGSKMSRSALRNRFYNAGVTQRLWELSDGDGLTLRRRCRYARNLLLNIILGTSGRLLGNAGTAFERELDAWRLAGVLMPRRCN